ncbi:MAG: ABC transporter substrate-binding protein [Muribaculaceae bacterium]|nr:ABC transporter substrate-binding protein [Muribaculaceae bacterium]
MDRNSQFSIFNSQLKIFLNYALCIVTCALLSACSPHRTHPDNLDDFSETLYTPAEASGFSITGREGSESTLLTVTDPWQGADSVASRLFIERDGDEAPLAFSGQVLDGEAKKIAVTSSTHVAMLDALGAADRIVAVSGIDYITNPAVQKRRDEIADIGYEGNFDYEALLAADPDIVLLYGVNGANSMEGKLKELQIPYIYIGDYLEQSPLGKAEWIVPVAEIIGERAKGERQFEQIARRYSELRENVAESVKEKPKVMLNVPYGDSWFMPSAGSYMGRLIKDAGADYVYTKETGNTSMPIDLEEAYTLASEADFWLNTDRMESLSMLAEKCPKFKDTRAIRDGRVYNNTRRANQAGGNDFYESAIVNPDILLRDLVAIFHPELVKEDLFYYKKLN